MDNPTLKLTRQRVIVIGLAILVIALIVVGVFRGDNKPRYDADVNFHVGVYASNGLIRVADQMGYFEQAGINANVISYAQGAQAYTGFVDDEGIAFFESSQVVLAHQALTNKDLRAVTQLSEFDDFFHWVVGPSLNVTDVNDFSTLDEAFVIGVPPLSASRAFSFNSLRALGLIDGVDYELVDIDLADAPELLASGAIEAFPSRGQLSGQAVDLVPGAKIVPHQGVLLLNDLLSTTPQVLNDYPGLTEAVLWALLEADALLSENPQVAVDAYFAHLGQSSEGQPRSFLDGCYIRFGDSTLAAMEDSRLFLGEYLNRDPEDFFVDVRDIVDPEPLRTVAPERYTVG